MSALADEIVKHLGRRRKGKIALTAAQVDKVLADLGIPTSASKGMPVHLRVVKVSFSGTKRLDPAHPDAEGFPLEEMESERPQLKLDLDSTDNQEVAETDSSTVDVIAIGASDVERGDQDSEEVSHEPVVRALVPFDFTWNPVDGVNGVGSGVNLRGKSSIVNVLLWSLSGRCAEFSVAVRRWIEHIEVDWEVGDETLRVAFDATNGKASAGTVTVVKHDGTLGTVIARFDSDSFEDAMNSVMLNRLRLESFTVSQNGNPVQHKWVSYVNALWVRPKYLKSIIGKEPMLSIRLMQMFIGTDWVPILATASTIAGTLQAEQKAADTKTQTASDAVRSARIQADKAVEAVKVKIAALPAGTPDAATVAATNIQIADLARQIHGLETRLLSRSVAASNIRRDLKAEKARHHTEHEHALLTKFFHQMKPTVCPRCSAGVTAERHAAEPDEHKCSVCTTSLNLEALKENVIVADSVDAGVTTALVASTAAVTAVEVDDEDPEPVSEIEALDKALKAVETVMGGLRDQIDKLQVAHDDLAQEINHGETLLKAAEERRLLDLELARAEGAAEALAAPVAPADASPFDPVQFAVAQAAETVLGKWVKNHQDPLLSTISTEIERLVVNFGADGLSNIKLDGAANMKLRQNGDKSNYGLLSPGEQLRLKIASVIALIKHGYVENIGRHPGFLLLDSPAAEEMPDGDLATMVSALLEVADEAPMQIIVATRSTNPLVELLPPENTLIAVGDNYVW